MKNKEPIVITGCSPVCKGYKYNCEIVTNQTTYTHNYTLSTATTSRRSHQPSTSIGVTLQSDTKFNHHIDNMVTKANRTLPFLRRNLKIGSTYIKGLAYKALVRPYWNTLAQSGTPTPRRIPPGLLQFTFCPPQAPQHLQCGRDAPITGLVNPL